ncbi:ankyrin repeat domain-containing protein [Telluria beijingensis]|uniref:ankyrin repeat domain-containing protein n=1 Tax=Telluria beijingensis TaxID=3068633 RepID=UPI002795FE02|nr:ankyrin repeat domain-containing protein [Massilia sp. REN29]
MSVDLAIRAGDLAALRAQLLDGADPGVRNPEGFTPLMVAAGLGHTQAVELLLAAGADVHALDSRMGASALHKAAQSGNADVVRVLLAHGAFIDQQSPSVGNTALMDAVLHKHHEVVRALLDGGARTTPVNHAAQTALDLAREDGLDAIAGSIEARDAGDAARIGGQALMRAVREGNHGEVGRLLAAGHPVDERTPIVGGADDDCTPLGMAARLGHARVVRALLEGGADMRLVNGPMKATAAHEAAYFGHADALRVLLDWRQAGGQALEIDAQGDYNGLSALHDAVWHGHAEAAQVLVDAGARRDLVSHAGLTPHALALLYGYREIADALDAAPPGMRAG